MLKQQIDLFLPVVENLKVGHIPGITERGVRDEFLFHFLYFLLCIESKSIFGYALVNKLDT